MLGMDSKPSFRSVFRLVWYVWLSFVLIDLVVLSIALAVYAAWFYSALPLVAGIAFAVCVACCFIWFAW